MFDILPPELIDIIYKKKYRLEYDDVINQINNMFENGLYSFNFKRFIIKTEKILTLYENDDEDITEILFYDVLDVYIV